MKNIICGLKFNDENYVSSAIFSGYRSYLPADKLKKIKEIYEQVFSEEVHLKSNANLMEAIEKAFLKRKLIAHSPLMEKTKTLIEKISSAKAVLVLGPAFSGKTEAIKVSFISCH